MNQFYLFIILFTITCVILLYQAYTFEGFVNREKINGTVSLDSNDIFIDIGKKTGDDAILKSNNTLYVKDKINFNSFGVNLDSIDEELFKKIKSFSEIYYFDYKKNEKLCLKDKNDKKVCCDKVDLGVLTGQTPIKFKLIQPKSRYEDKDVNKDEVYNSINVSKDGKKTSFYDKTFFILPRNMTTAKNTGQIVKDKISSSLKPVFSKTAPDARFDSANTMMTGFADKNYYCYLLNQSGNITTVA